MAKVSVPSPGRDVHFCASWAPGVQEGTICPAKVLDGRGRQDPLGQRDLGLFTTQGYIVKRGVPHAREYRPGCWSWPPQVAPVEVADNG